MRWHAVADGKGVGGVQAPGRHVAVEIDTRVERLAVGFAAGHAAVAEGISAGDAAIGIEVAELGGLREADRAAIECRRRR